jgi:multidrug efflux pump subunit AcrA (membrane-fusion protein)
VHEANAGRIEPGQRAMIKVDAIRDKVFSAEVMEIGVLAESGGWRDPNLREYTVKLLLDESNGGEELKPSMRCEAEIVIDRVEDSLAVPSQAVFRDGSTTFVYTPEGAKFKRTPVSVGRRSTRFAEITNGVTPGERVLLREPLAGEILRDRRAEPAPETQMAAEEAGPERARSSKKDVESVEARAAAE